MGADWERIRIDYCAGVKTTRQIATEHGLTHGAINKRAKKEEWPRDLTKRIKAKLEEKVSKLAVSKEVSKERLDTEKAVIEANAQMQADIIVAHRSDIRRNRNLAISLLAELEAQTNEKESFEKLAEYLKSEEVDLDKLEAQFRRAISTPSRVDSAKKLADTLKTLIGLEREAFGIEQRKSVGQSLDDFLDGLAATEAG